MIRSTKKIPDWVIFDLDNTVYEYEPCHKAGLIAASRIALSEFGISPRVFFREYKNSRAAVKSRISGASSHNRLLYFTELIGSLHMKLDLDAALTLSDTYWASYFLKMKPAEGYERLINALRHRGAGIALVTDQIADIQHKKLMVLGAHKHFDFLVTSEECSGEKKTLAPFELLFSRIGNDNIGDIWFIGDEIHDWPHSMPLSEKKFFASPFARATPRYVQKISSYSNLAKQIQI